MPVDPKSKLQQSLSVTKVARTFASAVAKFLGEPIEDVRYGVRIKGGPDPGWRVRRIRFKEGVSEPYELTLDMVAERPDAMIEADELLGADVELDLERNGTGRSILGLINRVSSVGIESGHLAVRVQVVPAWVYLAQHVDTRIFQDRTVPEILTEVLEPALGQYGRKLDTSRLHEKYVVRDYCVQYAESIFDFASRLMEEEGICYVFRPELDGGKPKGVELMVLTDQEDGSPNADFEDIEGVFDDEVHIISDRPGTADVESIQIFDWSRPEQVNKIVMRRFNWKRPFADQAPEAERAKDARRGREREIYIPDDRRRVEDKLGDDAFEGTEVDEDERHATRHRFELMAGTQGRGQGASNLVGMCAGGIFKLAEHLDPAVDGQKLLVTRVIHAGESPEADRDGNSDTETHYQNSFECIRADEPLRPAIKTRRPRIYGPQTAIVTGPEGEEIYTDQYGRIKVRFHWDRISPADDTSSCWIRVAQTAAGSGWGSWFVPRVGMEVLVEFLDGNPDRPIVTGCVYNGLNKPPLALPDQKTKSTIKSSTSPGGEGSNELRFEDAKDGQEIYLHAQKDFNEVVENDHTGKVVANETYTIGGNRTITVDGNHAITIKGVGSDGSELGGPHFMVKVDKDYRLEVSNTIYVTAESSIVFQVKDTRIELDPKKITLQAGNGAKVELDVDALVQSKPGASVLLDDAGKIVAKSTAPAVLTLAEAAKLESSSGAFTDLTSSAVLSAAGGDDAPGATITLSTDAEVVGNMVLVNSEGATLAMTKDAALDATKIAISGDDTSIQGASALVGKGGKVEISGAGTVNIQAPLVKLN